ncbi:hypothetical protein FB451DRAFT_1021680 [Mycena latifolia]|nr:hypothetical protein FB451DRAFT_1021680 [Mycena latifolia]
MSWIGSNEVPEATQILKNKLSSKETHIAAQQNEILKQAAELADLKTTLNDTLHKVRPARAVALESTLAKCTEDLRNEALVSQNAAAALAGAHEKLRAKDLEARELEATLESISHKSDTFNARGAKLEKEKGTLEARVRELEGNLRQLSSPAPTAATPARQRAPRRRSSSVSDTRITGLEQDLKDARASLALKETELRVATTKLAQVQNDLVKVENEKLASDKRFHAEMRDLQLALQEKNEDLEYMKEQRGDGEREDELLKRIDEDEAKIAALERLLAQAPETQRLKDRVRRVEQELLVEAERALEMEGQHIELVREKEEALDEVEAAQEQISKLSEVLRQKETVIAGLNAQRQTPPAQPAAEEDIERLLGAIERIRGERDDLRRDVHFLQTEAKFTEEALRAKIEALSAANGGPPSPDSPFQAEVQVLQQRLADATKHEQTILHQKNQEIRRMGLAAMASAVVIEHLRSQVGSADQLLTASTTSEHEMEDVCRKLKDVELQLGAASQSLDAMTRQRDELLAQLALKETEWMEESDRVRAAHQDNLAELDAQLADMSRAFDDVETERDALSLQVTNLLRDLEDAQREIEEGETRYSALQFHQLSAMTSNDAAHALREQLAATEARVLRRTELVGILQHDGKRLETNLKLQEERLSEMTTELEVMAAQKDAMVEDCADARQARDAAIQRVEDLEVEVEALEARLDGGDLALCTLVGVVMETVNRSRHALRQLRDKASIVMEPVAAAADSIDWEARVSELDKKYQALQLLMSSMEASHQAEIQHLNGQLAEKDRLVSDNDLEGELARLKVKHVEEMGLLQGQLIEATSALDEAQARCAAAEENYRQALSESMRSKLELESAASDAVTQADGLRSEIARVRDEHAVAVRQLRDQVASAVSEAHKAQAAHQELETLHQRAVGELVQARETSGARLQQFEDRVTALHSQLEAQTAQCGDLAKEADALRDQLQQEAETHVQEQQEHQAALHDAQQRLHHAESLLGPLKQELSAVAAELAQARSEVESSQEETTALQEEITALQAEIQRSKGRSIPVTACFHVLTFLEREQLTASLTSDLEHVKSQHARAEKAGKAAEVNLSLQSAQHRREMSELQSQLAALQSQPDLGGVIAELEERNNEMEELLKNKCAEIEENDDRALEMLKNNKKLATKVESLTRKVQNLQAKLAAAKASNPNPSPSVPTPPPVEAREHKTSPAALVVPSVRQRSNTLSAIPPVPPLPSYAPSNPVRAPSNRVASGSSLPRPKTPERKAPPPVFKAQTPERRIAPICPSPSAPVLGQKRRAPDDFEDVNVPTQGFTPESLPDENGTPRVRRVLNSLHSGFTPVRQNVRSAISSPNRALPAARSSPYISDVTNSPRLGDTAKSKRSWLGKIRGTSQPRVAHSRTGDF